MSSFTAYNVIKLMDTIGEEGVQEILSDFSCEKNLEIEIFVFQYADDSTGQMMSMLSGILDRNLTKKEKLDVLEDYGIDVGYDDVRIA